MADPQEHYGVTTSTGNGAYDQICAFSQTLINNGFQELYKVSSDLQKMYSLDSDVGKIDATLLPPEVIIPGADEATKVFNVIFLLKYRISAPYLVVHTDVIRFNDGKLYNKKSDIVISSLKNFVLAYKVDLESAESTAKKWTKEIEDYQRKLETEKDEEEIKSIKRYMGATKKKLDYFVKTYKVPGDYSFKRLFLKLSCMLIPANFRAKDPI
jgi:hypothetical protein